MLQLLVFIKLLLFGLLLEESLGNIEDEASKFMRKISRPTLSRFLRCLATTAGVSENEYLAVYETLNLGRNTMPSFRGFIIFVRKTFLLRLHGNVKLFFPQFAVSREAKF